MDQRLVDEFIAYFKAVPKSIDGATISTTMRKDVALKLMDFTDDIDRPDVEDTRFYILQDEFGDMSVSAIRLWLYIHDLGYDKLPEDDLLARFQLKTGKLAAPACEDIGPFYIASHVGQPAEDDYENSARDIRRILQGLFDDNWNVYTTKEMEDAFQSKTGRTLRRK